MDKFWKGIELNNEIITINEDLSVTEYDSDAKYYRTIKVRGKLWNENHENVFVQILKKKIFVM